MLELCEEVYPGFDGTTGAAPRPLFVRPVDGSDGVGAVRISNGYDLQVRMVWLCLFCEVRVVEWL